MEGKRYVISQVLLHTCMYKYNGMEPIVCDKQNTPITSNISLKSLALS